MFKKRVSTYYKGAEGLKNNRQLDVNVHNILQQDNIRHFLK
jgi:hypothetical protein